MEIKVSIFPGQKAPRTYHGSSRINKEKENILKNLNDLHKKQKYPLLTKEGTKGWLIDKSFAILLTKEGKRGG